MDLRASIDMTDVYMYFNTPELPPQIFPWMIDLVRYISTHQMQRRSFKSLGRSRNWILTMIIPPLLTEFYQGRVFNTFMDLGPTCLEGRMVLPPTSQPAAKLPGASTAMEEVTTAYKSGQQVYSTSRQSSSTLQPLLLLLQRIPKVRHQQVQPEAAQRSQQPVCRSTLLSNGVWREKTSL